MVWEAVLKSALVGAIIGAVVTLIAALIIRKTCPHCQQRYKLGFWVSRKVCPRCGGDLPTKKK